MSEFDPKLNTDGKTYHCKKFNNTNNRKIKCKSYRF